VTISSEIPSPTPSQIQALTNEYKGHVFEYLVAQLLAQRCGVEKDFLDHFGGQIKQRLIHYESWLRQVQPDLVAKLNQNAIDVVHSAPMKELIETRKIKRVVSMGKTAQSGQFKAFEEADILLIDQSDQLLPISLKLTTQGSALHTKSAGMKSFFTQYFAEFSQALAIQDQFNKACHQAYTSLCFDLLSIAGLEDCQGSDQFSKVWKDSGYSDLPGGLDGEMRQRLHQCYFEMSHALRLGLDQFIQEDSSLFQQALLPLFGLGLDGMVQLTCLESPKGESLVTLLTREDCQRAMERELYIEAATQSQSSIYLRLDGLRLGLRIKPMNRFTQPGFKVNCSYSKITSRE
jgi:hypothetical protein